MCFVETVWSCNKINKILGIYVLIYLKFSELSITLRLEWTVAVIC